MGFISHLVKVFLFLLFLSLPNVNFLYSNESEDQAFEHLLQMRGAYQGIQDYTATFTKQERRNGKLAPKETIQFLFKRPFQVKMEWLSGKKKGQEAVFVEGENNNLLLVRVKGIIGRFIRLLKLDPEGSFALKSSNRSIKKAGVGNLIESIIAMTAQARSKGVLDLKIIGEEKIEDHHTIVIERNLPSNQYDSPKTLIYIDKESQLPVKISRFDKEGDLMEEYSYANLSPNKDLSDTLFNLDKNPLRQDLAERNEKLRHAENLLNEAAKFYGEIKSYETTFLKQEELENGLSSIETYQVKYLKPNYVYLKQIVGPRKGLEMFYAPDDDPEKVLVVPKGTTGMILKILKIKAVPIDINSEIALREHRHPITQFGFEPFITTYKDNLIKGFEDKDLYIDIDDWKDQHDKGKRVELILKNKKRLPEYYAARSIVFFSEKLKLPTDIRIFNESGDLLEWYRYRDLRFNTDLKPSDFKP